MKHKSLNYLTLLESISLFCISALLTYLLLSKKIFTLIIPNIFFVYTLWGVAISSFLYSLWHLKTIHVYTLHKSYKSTFLYGLCSILLLFPAIQSNAMSYADDDGTVDQIIEIQKSSPNPEKNPASFNDGIDRVHKRIILTSQNYYNTIVTITSHLDEYKGYTIHATGFVSYHDQGLKGNDFVLARTLMICCAADMTPFGLPTEHKEETALRENTWYSMSGTIGERTFHGMKQPYITHVTLQEAAEIDGYIFPK